MTQQLLHVNFYYAYKENNIKKFKLFYFLYITCSKNLIIQSIKFCVFYLNNCILWLIISENVYDTNIHAKVNKRNIIQFHLICIKTAVCSFVAPFFLFFKVTRIWCD